MRRFLLGSCCLAAIVSAAHAQTATSPLAQSPDAVAAAGLADKTAPPPGEGGRLGSISLENIVVTAQKRADLAQKVPASVATVTPQTLSRSGVRDFDTITKVLPDVRVEDIFGATNLAVRGVRESALGPTSDSPTAVHLDGIFLSRPTGLSGLFYDLARVEELPGPQGTLYGRNATGGVINLITNKPSNVLGGYIEAEGGNYGLYRKRC